MTKHDDPMLKVYTARAQTDKAISTLKGILLGINLDNEVREKEINELHKWAEHHNELITRNPFNEFMTIIAQATENKIPTKETIEDLFWLCQKYECDNYYYKAVTTDLQTLQGLCHGILSDGVISDKEINGLDRWLSENEHLKTYYPYDELRSLILSILSDHKVENEERLVLKAFFNEFIRLEDKVTDEQNRIDTADIHIEGLCTSEPQVIFPGKTFCITGILQRGTREDLQRDILKLGGIPTESVNKKTDYLIVGDNGNPAWAFSCYGRKVEKALALRKEGHTIILIHEFDFGDIVDDLL